MSKPILRNRMYILPDGTQFLVLFCFWKGYHFGYSWKPGADTAHKDTVANDTIREGRRIPKGEEPWHLV